MHQSRIASFSSKSPIGQTKCRRKLKLCKNEKPDLQENWIFVGGDTRSPRLLQDERGQGVDMNRRDYTDNSEMGCVIYASTLSERDLQVNEVWKQLKWTEYSGSSKDGAWLVNKCPNLWRIPHASWETRSRVLLLLTTAKSNGPWMKVSELSRRIHWRKGRRSWEAA